MRNAFSLVELSIVLVILGLLVGGVLAGKSLIRAAEIRSITTEAQRYATAIYSFREKYFFLPGDIPNATQLWQTATVCPGTSAEPSTDSKTCNGNGDGFVGQLASTIYERFRLWQHLANAGLIEGTYTGVPGSAGNNHVVIGQNTPTARLTPAGWAVLSNATVGNWMQFGVGQVAVNGSNLLAAITPEEAWNVDTKMDDGNPGVGKIRATTALCTDGVAAPAGVYALSTTDIVCALQFYMIP
ncbi:MAG: prepilin-type N-terminal cleavage/methylation domain-containing protein [Pseudomonadota bacterium]